MHGWCKKCLNKFIAFITEVLWSQPQLVLNLAYIMIILSSYLKSILFSFTGLKTVLFELSCFLWWHQFIFFFFKVNWNFYCYVFLAISKNELNGMSKYVISRLHDLKRRTLQRLKSGICKDRNWNPADLVFGFWNPVLQNPESKTL